MVSDGGMSSDIFTRRASPDGRRPVELARFPPTHTYMTSASHLGDMMDGCGSINELVFRGWGCRWAFLSPRV